MDRERKAMSAKQSEDDSPTANLKNDEARQRWELFHRAIAHAKQSNDQALAETEELASESDLAGPILTIVR